MSAEKECKPDRMAVERLFAYGFVLIGGIFWTFAVFGSDYGYGRMSPMVSTANALFPLVLTITVFVLGWFFERAASIMLVLTAAGVALWGAVTGWEIGVWSLMAFTLMGPMLVAAMLYWLAATMQKRCDLAAKAGPPVEPVASS
jgi:hypothetical protein